MLWNQKPRELPSITYPVGAVIEDHKTTWKVLEGPIEQDMCHKYKCQILKRKEPAPLSFSASPEGGTEWVLIVAHLQNSITRIE